MLHPSATRDFTFEIPASIPAGPLANEMMLVRDVETARIVSVFGDGQDRKVSFEVVFRADNSALTSAAIEARSRVIRDMANTYGGQVSGVVI